MNQRQPNKQFDNVPIQVHPRVFEALGSDLVTNDIVAVIELVKNAYDAFAHNVRLSFKSDPTQGDYLEIADDGQGMLRKTIENAWCVVATPNKKKHTLVESADGLKRRVSGEKGLGRLSAARLGSRLDMLTKYQDNPCWEVMIDWSAIASGDDISQSFARLREFSGRSPFEAGTRLRIFELKNKWDKNRKKELMENLGRLISPFESHDEFNIYFCGSPETESESTAIQAPEFLSHPKYCYFGDVDNQGNLRGTYQFTPVGQETQRCVSESIKWPRICRELRRETPSLPETDSASCGPFSFKIRAWDPDVQNEIAAEYEITKTIVRKAIRDHKGISVYRDNVLMLPKTESGRDWLGLDLRRIVWVGRRLSTNQIVGHVQITAVDNPRIRDTSDRERLVSCTEVTEFKGILKAIVSRLETNRSEDRETKVLERPMRSLFEELSAEGLLENVESLSAKNAQASEALPLVRAFKKSLEDKSQIIQKRFVYYSRLATVGSIAEMLIHEVRGRTTIFGSFIKFVQNKFLTSADTDVEVEIQHASDATDALDRLADTIAPLATRRFRRRLGKTILEDRIGRCIAVMQNEIKAKRVVCNRLTSITPVAVDPGELDTILLNLISNSLYWLSEVPKDQRRLEFEIEYSVPNKQRVTVKVRDTGPGIAEEYLDKVFWPGVTLKPSGIGMGLTVASELVASYNGRMYTRDFGESSGAVFGFDLPLRSQP